MTNTDKAPQCTDCDVERLYHALEALLRRVNQSRGPGWPDEQRRARAALDAGTASRGRGERAPSAATIRRPRI